MNEYFEANLKRLSELKTEVDAADSRLQEAENTFQSVRQRFVNLQRFLEAEITIENDDEAMLEFRKIIRPDVHEAHQLRLYEAPRRQIDIRQLQRRADRLKELNVKRDEPATDVAGQIPAFNKTRFIVEIWARENAEGIGVTPKQVFEVAQNSETGRRISLGYIHNTFSRFKQTGRAEQRNDGHYYLTAAGLEYLQGGDT